MKDSTIHKLKKVLGKDVISFLYRSLSFLPDDKYLKLLFRIRMGRKLDLENPKTFNEKQQWLKIHNRKDEYTVMADKYLSKQYVAGKVGEQYVVPVLGAWDSFDDIDFDSLPDRFVLKTNHDSGSVIICSDKAKLDRKKARAELEKSLRRSYYAVKREWPYKNIPRKILAEAYLEDEPGRNLMDYKFFCFEGVPKLMYVIEGAAETDTEAFFDMDRNFLELEIGSDKPEVPPELPSCFEKMKELAAVLSNGLPFIRVDFFYVKGRLYVGELTFFHDSGLAEIRPAEWDLKLGEMIDIDKIREQKA